MKIFNILVADNQLIILNYSYKLDDKVTEIFVSIDDFMIQCKNEIEFVKLDSEQKANRIRKSQLADSEIMTIVGCFHQSNYTNCKAFYKELAQRY